MSVSGGDPLGKDVSLTVTGEPLASGQTGSQYKPGHDLYVKYSVLDVPPWYETCLLGFQHYLTMLGSTVLIPSLLVPAMGGSDEDLAHVICTIFFASGVVTLVQTLVGDRLPIVNGGSFAYLTPSFAIIAQIKAKGGFVDEHERFLVTMRELQGGIIGSGLMVMLLGMSGLLNVILNTISPITVAANIAIVGLSLYSVGMSGVANCLGIGILQMVTIILLSQYLKNISVPLPRIGRWRIFELFPVLLGILVTWFVAWILTITGTYDGADAMTQKYCRTDQSTVLHDVEWFRFPYPGQWGAPVITWTNSLTMLAGALSAMVESIGDYYAAARISGAPVPPPDVISRAVSIQGFSCVLTGIWGTGNGTTAYNENIGAMQITGVGSRRVVQAGAIIIIIVSVIGKFGGLFASLPGPMVSALFCIMFGLIAAVGLSQMQHANQNSPRNIFILGFGLFMALSVPNWIDTYTAKHGHAPVNTTSQGFNDVINAILHTGAAVALIITLFLDNTIPGTIRERGLHVWSKMAMEHDGRWWEDDYMNKVYGLPFNLTRKYQAAVGIPLRAWAQRTLVAPMMPVLGPLGRTLAAVFTCGGHLGTQPEPEEGERDLPVARTRQLG